METLKPIVNRFEKGFYVQLECCMCQHTEIYAAKSESELQDILNESEWRKLDSDLYGLVGDYCGCDYIDEYE